MWKQISNCVENALSKYSCLTAPGTSLETFWQILEVDPWACLTKLFHSSQPWTCIRQIRCRYQTLRNTKISCKCTQAKLKVEKQVQQFIIRIISVNTIIYFFWNLRIRIQLIYFKLKQLSLCFLVTGNANFRMKQTSFTWIYPAPHRYAYNWRSSK